MIPKHIAVTIILVLIKNVSSYKRYKYHELCPANKFRNIFDTANNNKPTVKLNQDYLSAALVSHQWNSTTNPNFNTCSFDVKLENSNASGIFVLIKTLKLRERKEEDDNNCGDEKCGPCIDYLKLTYKNGTRTREICGNIKTTVEKNLIRNFFDENSGEIRVEISINNSYSFWEVNSTLEIDLVFTAYSNCHNDTNEVACSPVKCISDIFANDSILNCPPPGCSDESGCINFETTPTRPSTPSSPKELYIVMSLVVVIVCTLVCLICCCNKRKPTVYSPQRNNNAREQELRPIPTPVSDFDSYLEFQNVRPNSLVLPDPQNVRASHSAPRVGFKTDPPTYDALFNANTHKRPPEPIIKKF